MEDCEERHMILETQEALNNLTKEGSLINQIEETKEAIPPPPLEEVEAILGYEFKNKCLLEEAYTHETYSTKNNFSYECLEYVGDSVLNLLVTKEQFFWYPKLDSGKLTHVRSTNVDGEKLARVAVKHGLHRYLRHKISLFEEQIDEFINDIQEYPLHSKGLIKVPKDLADIVESTIGAVFIDCGFSIEIVWKVFQSLLEPFIGPDYKVKHPMTELNEICQKHNLKIQFVDLWEESKIINVIMDGKIIGTGACRTKKHVAQSRAAKDALKNIDIVSKTKKITDKNVL